MGFLSKLKYEIKKAQFKKECEKEYKKYLQLCEMQGDSPVCFYDNGKTTAVRDYYNNIIVRHEENNEISTIITYELISNLNVYYRVTLDTKDMDYNGIEYFQNYNYNTFYELGRFSTRMIFEDLEQRFEKAYSQYIEEQDEIKEKNRLENKDILEI